MLQGQILLSFCLHLEGKQIQLLLQAIHLFSSSKPLSIRLLKRFSDEGKEKVTAEVKGKTVN